MTLTKGRLEKAIMELLRERGYGIESLRSKEGALVFQNFEEDIRYFLVKPNGYITYIRRDVAGIGVVGKDTLLEGSRDYYEMLDSGIGKCKFVVASLREHSLFNKVGHVKVGTKYPDTAKRYFLEKGVDVECIKINSSVELAPVLGLYDGIVGITETGVVPKENGLVVFDTVYDISARMIVNKANFKLKRTGTLAILEDMKKGPEAC